MLESRDPAIKLFGKTIALPLACDEGSCGDDDKGSPTPSKEINIPEREDKQQESPNAAEKTETEQAMDCSTGDETQNPNSSDDQETAAEQQQESNSGENPQEKPALKKPDKILPCPRCNSMDTKFCYYNNYNVNQPRHFCKNCQRYWTAGGTMRNVPVGAGRRKNKNSAVNHYRHLTMTDAALQAIPDQIHHPALPPNGTVLSFGSSDPPLCESMSSVLTIADKAIKNCNRNGFQRIEEQSTDSSSAVSATNSSVAGRDDANGANIQETGFAPHPLPYINGSPWPYPWGATMPPPPPGAPAAATFCASSFPIPIYPAAAYWGCGAWSIPWIAPLASPPTASGGGSSGSGPTSPTLGKHSRDGSSSSSDRGEANQSLWIPKTLRIDDPEAAAKSSIWATMGFKNEKSEGLFKPFQRKAELSISHKFENSQLFHANPAALSRSLNFQESS